MANPYLRSLPAIVLLGAMLGTLGCGSNATQGSGPSADSATTKPANPEPVAVPPEATPKGTPEAAPRPPEKSARTKAPSPASPSAPLATTLAPVPSPQPKSPEAPKPAAAPAPPTSPMSDPGGAIAVPATKAGLARVGAATCKMCHKVQFASWSETAHAKRAPQLDCEGCHGPGSDYKSLAVMKDPAKAKAAGLVMPGAGFCTTCHKRGWSDGMLKKAHAHKG